MKVIRAINTLVSAAREVFPDHGTAGPCKVARKLLSFLFFSFFFSMLQGSLNMCKTITCLCLLIAVFVDTADYKE